MTMMDILRALVCPPLLRTVQADPNKLNGVETPAVMIRQENTWVTAVQNNPMRGCVERPRPAEMAISAQRDNTPQESKEVNHRRSIRWSLISFLPYVIDTPLVHCNGPPLSHNIDEQH
jgi:hypothetical protein